MFMSRWRKKHKKDIEIENKREGKTVFFFKESGELSKHE